MGHKNRAERRHHHYRMLEKVKTFSYYQYDWNDDREKELHQKKTAENRKPCSCHMCRNPRHSGWYKGEGKLTMQEKRIMEYERYDGEHDERG